MGGRSSKKNNAKKQLMEEEERHRKEAEDRKLLQEEAKKAAQAKELGVKGQISSRQLHQLEIVKMRNEMRAKREQKMQVMCMELEESAKKVVEEEFQIDEEYMRMLQNQNLENCEAKDA